VHEALKGAGAKYEIVAEQTANWSPAESLMVTQNVLDKTILQDADRYAEVK
jgi:ABC-type sugar transport system substrate-binding protein